MSQLIVRKLPESLVRLLKLRAAAHGVSAEEEHRRILREALTGASDAKPSLIEFLSSEEILPEVELPIDRTRETESRSLGL